MGAGSDGSEKVPKLVTWKVQIVCQGERCGVTPSPKARGPKFHLRASFSRRLDRSIRAVWASFIALCPSQTSWERLRRDDASSSGPRPPSDDRSRHGLPRLYPGAKGQTRPRNATGCTSTWGRRG